MLTKLRKFFKKKERFPVIVSELKFRENGDVDFDPNSREPRFFEYNNTRLLIQRAKDEGKNSVATALSTACWNAIARDGYKIKLRKDFEPGNSERHIISW